MFDIIYGYIQVIKILPVDMAKVNTLIRPNGEKKAYVHPAPDYDALDVANEIGIIYTESSWLIPHIKVFTMYKKKSANVTKEYFH